MFVSRAQLWIKQHQRLAWIIAIAAATVAMLLVISQALTYSGTIYRCAEAHSSPCVKVPLAGARIYLLSGYDDRSFPAVVLQVTTSDADGRYQFFGVHPGAVAAVPIGWYEPNVITHEPAKSYCQFATNWAFQSHDINLLSNDQYRGFIGDFGAGDYPYPSFIVCPAALR